MIISAWAGTSRSHVSHLTSSTGSPIIRPANSGSGIEDGAQDAIADIGSGPITMAKGSVLPLGAHLPKSIFPISEKGNTGPTIVLES